MVGKSYVHKARPDGLVFEHVATWPTSTYPVELRYRGGTLHVTRSELNNDYVEVAPAPRRVSIRNDTARRIE